MIVTIDNDPDLHGTQDFLNIPMNKRTIPMTLRVLAEFYAHHEELEIQIHRRVFPTLSSYKVNPAQLAKNANVKNSFARASGHTRNEYIVVLFTNQQAPESFWAQCIRLSSEPGTYPFPIDQVPTTYRHTPSLLTYRLRQFTGKKIRILKSPTLFKLVVPRTGSPKI